MGWTPAVPINVDDLADVTTSGIADGEALVWDDDVEMLVPGEVQARVEFVGYGTNPEAPRPGYANVVYWRGPAAVRLPDNAQPGDFVHVESGGF